MNRFRTAAALLGLFAAGCAGLRSAPPVASPTNTRVVAADDNFAAGLAGTKAAVKLEAVSGTPTGAWRLDRGAGTAPAGPVNLLVGLWLVDKLLPLGAPDTFACLRFTAEAQTIYTVAAVANDGKYMVVVHNTSFNPSQQVASFEVPARVQATPPACGKPD